MIYRSKAAFKKFYDSQFNDDYPPRAIYEKSNLIKQNGEMIENIFMPALDGVQRFRYGNEYEVIEAAIDYGICAALSYIAKNADALGRIKR